MMTRLEILYLLPYLFSLLLSLGITMYAWQHRQVMGATAYAALSSSQTLIVFGFICELFSPELQGKLLWDKFQWVFFAVFSVLIPYFAAQYAEYELPRAHLFLGLISLPALLLIFGVLSDPWLHWIYPNPTFDSSYIFGELRYDFGWLVNFFAGYSYLAALAAFILLSSRLVRPHQLYRAQIATVIVGLLIPILGSMLPILNLNFTGLRDSTPITSALGDLVIAWGIFRYHWLNIVHIARDKILENMADLIFVLDADDRIIDINPSALKLLEATPEQTIGKPAIPIFSAYPEVLERFSTPADVNAEVVVVRDGEYHHYDVAATRLFNRQGQYQGRVFVARNITPYAALQWKLRLLNEELERRVQDRTVELAEAYDTTLEGWARALELRDKETEGHSRRVTAMTLKLAQAIGISPADLEQIHRGAILHDIGKMAIPDEILRKTGPLTPSERSIVSQHPQIAYQLLSPIAYLQKALDIPYCHHEKWDGTGYPRGLKGEEIPLAARIFCVADVWDAIQTDRPYNNAWPRAQAIEYFREQSGKHFDPKIVQVFLEMLEQDKI